MLNSQIIINEIRKINDEEFEEFEGFPDSILEATQRWSNVIYEYAKDILPPSTTHDQAKLQMAIVLSSINTNSNLSISHNILVNSIMSYCNIMIQGFLPTFNGVMPIGILNLEDIMIETVNDGTALNFAEKFANRVDTWFKTGTAINVNSGVTINWN